MFVNKQKGIIMKLIVILEMNESWVDEPEFSPCYFFNNMRECYVFLSKLGTVTINKEPNPCNLYDFGEIILTKNNVEFIFNCRYAECAN